MKKLTLRDLKRAAVSAAVGSSMAMVSAFSFAANAGGKEAATAAVTGAVSVAVVSGATGAALKVPCHTGMSPLPCILMGLAVVQVGMALVNKDGSAKSASDFAGTQTNDPNANGGLGGGTGSASLSADGSGGSGMSAGQRAVLSSTLGSLKSEYDALKKDVAAAGVTVSADGSSVTKDGKKVATSSLSSAAGMKAAGFSDAEISASQAAIADAALKAQERLKNLSALMNDAGGGGGGGAIASAGSGGSGSSYGAGVDSAAAKGKGSAAKAPAGVAGMSKKLGADNIGVSGDDIFEMITRRYQAKDKTNSFLKD